MTAVLAAAPASGDPIGGWLLVGAFVLGLSYFAVRPDVFLRLCLARVDPRPAALFRIAFGLSVLWTLADLTSWASLLFSDEGIFLPSYARKAYGKGLDRVFDPVDGFEGPAGAVYGLLLGGSVLHLRADPPFVYVLLGTAMAALCAMILGYRTRLATVLSWWLVEQIYRANPIFYNGGDIVVRVFLFLGVFTDWGRAYSLDAWRGRRRAVARGDGRIPPLRRIPAWPLRLAMFQLVIIYTATGWLKMGGTWWNGTALYYALLLDHFARVPMTSLVAWGQRLYVLPVLTHAVHLWEMFFPVVAVGAAMRGYLAHAEAGTWARVPRGRAVAGWAVAVAAAAAAGAAGGRGAAIHLPDPYLAGMPRVTAVAVGGIVGGLLAGSLASALLAVTVRRGRAARWIAHRAFGLGPWLGFGLAMHAGIDLTMNVGTFPQVMVATYCAFLSGRHVDALWRWVGTRRTPAPEGVRGLAWIVEAARGLRQRAPRPRYRVLHAPDGTAVRRATLLRPWDLAGRLSFGVEPVLPPGTVRLCGPSGEPLDTAAAGRRLARLLPGLWPLVPLAVVPAVARTVARRFFEASVSPESPAASSPRE